MFFVETLKINTKKKGSYLKKFLLESLYIFIKKNAFNSIRKVLRSNFLSIIYYFHNKTGRFLKHQGLEY